MEPIDIVCNLLLQTYIDPKIVEEANSNLGSLFFKQGDKKNLKLMQNFSSFVTNQMEDIFDKMKGISEQRVDKGTTEFGCPLLTISTVLRKIVDSFLLFLIIKNEQTLENIRKTPFKKNYVIKNNLIEEQKKPLEPSFMDFINFDQNDEPTYELEVLGMKGPQFKEKLNDCKPSLSYPIGLDLDDSMDSQYSRDFS